MQRNSDEKFFPVHKSFFEKVVTEAKNQFIPGQQYAELFLLKHTNHDQLHPIVGKDLNENVVSVIDDRFKRRANLLPDTNFIACEGPNFSQMENFFSDTIYNPHEVIDEVIALSNKVSSHPGRPAGEFHDYGLRERVGPYKYGNSQNQIFVNVKKICGEVEEKAYTVSPIKFVKSELSVTSTRNPLEKKLFVNFLEVEDGNCVSVADDERKDFLLDIAEKSKHKKILVHCAAGVGRTGSLILMFEILKNYEKIFSSYDFKRAAKEILNILESMRSVRPQLVISDTQFVAAINNAHILYQYAYEKYLTNNLLKEIDILTAPEVYVDAKIDAKGEVNVNLDLHEFQDLRRMRR